MKIHKLILGFSILIFSVLLLFLVRSHPTSHAQTSGESPEEAAAKHGITFPIGELGNCEDYSSCRTFCEDPVNQSTCIDFAKSKGFYQEDPIQTSKEEILASAKAELGCDSYDSCMSFCQDSSNFDKCDAFAKRHSLGGGHVSNTEEQQFLEKAKEVLGCDSPASCMNFCDEPDNRDKCSEFAKQMGVRGGHMEVGPGGCTSEETCREFCSIPQNYEVCATHGKASGSNFSGPGECNSEESCREYCSKNPKECGFEGTNGDYSYPVYNPQEMCSKTPDCSWNNNRCECIQEGTDYKGEDPQDYCNKYPEKCAYDTSHAAEQCASYPGCKWENNTCQCSQGDVQTQSVPTGYQNQQYPYPTHTYDPSGSQNYQQTTGSYDPASECAKTSGCSWTGSTCQCSNTQQTTSETQTQPPPSDSGSYSQPAVQGAAVNNGLLPVLLDFLKNLLNR